MSGGKGWDELSEDERDRFLLATVGGAEEWRMVMGGIGLDGNAAAKVATAICPMSAPPRSEAERRERERAALSFQGGRPMGLALRAALRRRDGPPEEEEAVLPAEPAPQPLQRVGMPVRVAPPGRSRPGLWQRTRRLADRLRPALRDSVAVLSEAAATVAARTAPRAAPARPDNAAATASILDGGLDGDDRTVRDDLRVLEAALSRWRGMGAVLKDMTVASALRGYSPALAFIRVIAPHVQQAAAPAPSEDNSEWEAEQIRHRRMLRALERERSPLFRLLRLLIPPIG